MKSDVWQDLEGLWHHEFSDELFESEDDAANDYEKELRKRG